MIRVFDFACEHGHVSEHFVDGECRTVNCSECGAPATRKLAAPRVNLDAISGHFPGATMSWERKREEKMAQERKTKSSHGVWRDGSYEKSVGKTPSVD